MKYLFKKKSYIFLASLLDGLGALFVRPFQKKPVAASYPAAHVLIVRLDHLGDVLAATGLPKILKENLPQCRVTFLTSSAAAPLLENNPFIDEALIYDAPWFSRKKTTNSVRGIGFFALARLLRQKKIQAALSLRGDLRENFLLWLARIPVRIGYGVTGGGFFLNKEVSYRRGVHESTHALDLLASLGIRCDQAQPQLYFSESEKHLSGPKEKWIGVQLEAGTEAKEWPEERMKTFIELCAKELSGHKIVFVGTDAKRFAWLSGSVEGNAQFVDLIGKTSLRELLLLLKQFKVFVGPDSGPAHLAASLGVPALFLYSGTNHFEEWKSLAESAFFLRHEVSCAPCGLVRCKVTGHPCLSGIEPDRVIHFIKEKIR